MKTIPSWYQGGLLRNYKPGSASTPPTTAHLPPATGVDLQMYLMHYEPGRITTFVFPVNASSIKFTSDRQSLDVALWSLGTVSRPGPRQPEEVNLTGFFPDPDRYAGQPSWMNVPVDQVQDPWLVRALIRRWQNEDAQKSGLSPIKFGIGPPANFSMWAIITSFGVETEGPSDLSFDITVREMIALPVLKQVKRNLRGQKKGSTRVNPNRTARTYKAPKGSTLILVAKAVYGSAENGNVRRLWQANRKLIGEDPHVKFPRPLTLSVPRD
jgi:hypothetical protein